MPDEIEAAVSFCKDSEGRIVFGSIGFLTGPVGRVARKWLDAEVEWLCQGPGKLDWETAWGGKIGYTSDHVLVRNGPRKCSP